MLFENVLNQLVQDISPIESEFEQYRFKPKEYIEKYFKWEPWSSSESSNPMGVGQVEILDAYATAIKDQFDLQEAQEYAAKNGEPVPTKIIKNWIRVESGHTTGKTKLASGIVSHFFDCFPPAIVYCYAPTSQQLDDTLFKEIRTDRRSNDMPGQVLDTPRVKAPTKSRGDWFVVGKAVGKSTESIQGQHGAFNLFILDEAEGIPEVVYDAVRSMASGGISIIMMFANPRTRTSKFHRIKKEPNVQSFRMSCLDHPNVQLGYPKVPHAVQRSYVDSMIETDCVEVPEHKNESYTFEVSWRPNKIFLPNHEFLFRVLGIPPLESLSNTFINSGIYEVAKKRRLALKPDHRALCIGVDVARFGNDYGTIYAVHDGRVWCVDKLYHQNTMVYYQSIKNFIKEYIAEHLEIYEIHIRVDGTGGYGGGIIDFLHSSFFLSKLENSLGIELYIKEVIFNELPHDPEKFADIITELYYWAGDFINSNIIDSEVPNTLEVDLTERLYGYLIKKGKEVKKLEPKKLFRKRQGHSPDDGDGFVLATAPTNIFDYDVNVGFA